MLREPLSIFRITAPQKPPLFQSFGSTFRIREGDGTSPLVSPNVRVKRGLGFAGLLSSTQRPEEGKGRGGGKGEEKCEDGQRRVLRAIFPTDELE